MQYFLVARAASGVLLMSEAILFGHRWLPVRWLLPNGLAFSCRERAAQDDFKKGPISREAVNCNHLSRWAVTSHQMTGRLLSDPA